MLFFRQRCTGPGTHKYEARYDNDGSSMTAEWVSGPARVYVRDVCIWCGDVKERLEGCNCPARHCPDCDGLQACREHVQAAAHV